MNIVVIDERGESPTTTELNGVINDTLTITIGKEGGIKFEGDPSDWLRHLTDWRNPLSDWRRPWESPFIVQDCGNSFER